MSFYTYMHTRADDGKVFYIGKGKGRRAWDFSGRSDWWKRTTQKHGCTVQVLAEWPDNQSAFEHEKLLIAAFREKGAPLVNLTDGGEGALGARRSEAFKAFVSRLHKGKVVSAETRAKQSASHKGQRLTEEHKQKLREANVGKRMTPEAIAKTRRVHLGAKRSEETRRRISESKKGKPLAPETRRKMSEAHLARHAKLRALQ